VTRSLHQIRQWGVKRLTSLHNTMIEKWFMVGKFLIMPYWILFEFQVLEFICNIYCIMLFVLGFEAPLRGVYG